ncbi:MAG: molecular chaperone DnaK, partial [Actinomycetota bacterium]|nr:molecular chaperone DnaK [Actinomycetota bacterium]
MGYDLGIDLGGTTVVAAVLREGAHRAEPVPLGVAGAVTLPATAHRGSDGTVRTGEEAEQWAAREPDGVVRDVTSRLGDDVPLVVGGEPWRADDVAAEIVLAAVRRVAGREGGPARALAVTHPAGWGLHRERTLRRALVRVGLGHATLIAETRAAALAGSRGTVAGVYDLGGRSFRAAVVRRDATGGVEVLADSGTPDRAGGTDVDAAVLALVREQLGDDLESARDELGEDEARLALAGLRDAAHTAKEQLSADTEAHVAVALGTLRTTVRITRADLEARITPLVAATVESFGSTVEAAGTPLDDVVLVGGSARIPLVARLLAEELGRPVHPDADPVTVVAQGAALAAAQHASARRRAATAEVPDHAVPSSHGVAGAVPTGVVPSARPAVGDRVLTGAAGAFAAGARHRAPERDLAAASAGTAATAAMTAAVATGVSAAADRRHAAATTGTSEVDHEASDGMTATPGRTATALLERPRSFADDVPRPPVTTADAPIGPPAPGALRRYRTWIVAGVTVLVLGAAAATVPIPGLTAARSTETPTPPPTSTPAPSASPAPTPAAPPPPAPSTTPSAAAPATDSGSSGDASSSSGGGSSTGSSSGTGPSSGTGSAAAGRHSSAARPSATRSTRSPAAPAPAPAAVAPAAPAPASPPVVA